MRTPGQREVRGGLGLRAKVMPSQKRREEGDPVRNGEENVV